MKKKEIEHRIKKYELVRECAEENLNELKIQLAEAEKPKLRHGDFGVTTRESIDEYDKFLIRKTPKGELEPEYQNGFTDGSGYAEKHPEEYTIFGNVFDLMRGWGKPFVEGYKGNCAMGIRIVGEHIEIYSCTGTNCNKEDDFCNFNIVSAERFHNALGHAIAELKRKKETE